MIYECEKIGHVWYYPQLGSVSPDSLRYYPKYWREKSDIFYPNISIQQMGVSKTHHPKFNIIGSFARSRLIAFSQMLDLMKSLS